MSLVSPRKLPDPRQVVPAPATLQQNRVRSLPEPAPAAPGLVRAAVLEQAEVHSRYRLLTLLAPEVARRARPGQFAMLGVGDGLDHHLRRPFSFYQAEPGSGSVAFLYRVEGRGTAWLAGRRPGEYVDLLAPLGRGFTLPASPSTPLLVVGGGIGLASLLLLVERAVLNRWPVHLFLGARSAGEFAGLDDFLALAREGLLAGLELATDDGSLGYRGTVTELLGRWLERHPTAGRRGRPHLYACGPEPMLEAVAALARQYELPAEGAMERPMACGVGACLGCTLPVLESDGQVRQVRVCREGPVFPLERVVFDG